MINKIKAILILIVFSILIKDVNAAVPPRRMILPDTLCVGFYNCENFFDYENDSTINDEEFLPNAIMKWDKDKFEIKTNHTAQVIASMNNDKGADIIGLCEIENKSVLEHLILDKQIKAFDYGIVHHNSPDTRGIDVAFLYKKNILTIESQKAYPVVFAEDAKLKTRDVLVAKAKLINGEIVYFIVNHFPSRRAGTDESEIKRITAAKVVRHIFDSLQVAEPGVKCIIMGDLNDTPNDKSIKDYLVKENDNDNNGLINAFKPLADEHQGTHYYKGLWDCFDQIILSKSIVSKNYKLNYVANSASIMKSYFLLEQQGNYKGAPYRTYVGNNYKGGYSDHLPVTILLTYRRF